MSCGNNPQRAFELARVNLANRPTLRAFEQAYEAALAAGKSEAADDIVVAGEKLWGGTGFRFSPLAEILRKIPGPEGAITT
jgi:hypothetical protein